MELLVANLAGPVRQEKWSDDREYLVAPISLIVPGVLEGSNGKLLYPKDKLAILPDRWNGMPVVVNHPLDAKGRPVSARSPAVLKASAIGFLAGAGFNKRLTAEGWFDVAATRRVDERIYTALTTNTKMEVSTGLFPVLREVPAGAVFNSRRGAVPYTHVVEDYRPDHLAVLPDQPGACSLADGCGLMVNGSYEMPDEQSRSWIRRLGEALGIVTNKPSHAAIEDLLGRALARRFGPEAYPVDVYDRQVVYRYQGKLWRLDYSKDSAKNSVMLSEGGPAEVSRLVSYRPVANSAGAGGKEPVEENNETPPAPPTPPNETPVTEEKVATNCGCGGGCQTCGRGTTDTTSPETNVKKTELITWIIANCAEWKDDKATLEQLTEARLEGIKATAEKLQRAEAVANAAKTGFEGTGYSVVYDEEAKKLVRKEAAPPPANNSAPPPPRLTAEQEEDLAFARAERARQKTLLIERLTANVAPEKKAAKVAELQELSLTKLGSLLDLLPPAPEHTAAPTGSFWGAVGGQPLTNQRPAVSEDDVLELPTMNFSPSDEDDDAPVGRRRR